MSDLTEAFAEVDSRDASKVAALDIGSNSFHLVVARIVAGSVQILHRVKQRVRLADGLDDKNALSQEAMQRGLSTLGGIAESLQGFEPDSVRIVATYTLRKATNAKDFIKAASYILPYPVEVISGTEEARLIYAGVSHTNYADGRQLVVDIGGGSTEFIIGKGHSPELLRSVQMGCVSYTKKFFADGVLSDKAFDKAITAAQQELENIEDHYLELGWNQCIGTSGTIRIIAQLCQAQHNQGPENRITLAGLKELINECIATGDINKLKFSELSPERKPVFAAGLAVLTAVFTSLGITEMTYSTAALREGVIYEMEEQLTHPDIRERTAHSLATRYDVDTLQAKLVLETTMTLYHSIATQWGIDSAELKSMLGWAALLHEVGLQINSRGVQRHSAYILENVDLPGFNQEQQALLSTLVRFHRKKIRIVDKPSFYQYPETQANRLIALLRLGVLLNIKRQQGIVPEFGIKAISHGIELTFPRLWLAQNPIVSADLKRESEQLKTLNLRLEFS